SCPEWNLKSLLLESGLLSEREMEKAAVMHVCTLVARLVDIGKGSFRLLLNETALVHVWDNFKLAEGLDIGEVLLQSATESDEAQRDAEPAAKMASAQAESANRKVLAAGAGHSYKSGEHHREAGRPPTNVAAG